MEILSELDTHWKSLTVRWTQYIFCSHNTCWDNRSLFTPEACKMLHAWSSYWLRKRTLNYIFLLSPHRIILSVFNVIKEARGCVLITGPLTWDEQQFVEDREVTWLGMGRPWGAGHAAGRGQVLGSPVPRTLVMQAFRFYFEQLCSKIAIWSQLFGTLDTYSTPPPPIK